MSGDRASTPESPGPLHCLTSEEVPRAVEVLARSFAHDPLIDWLARSDAKRAEAIRVWFTVCLRHWTMPLNEVWATQNLEGVALWAPPGKFHVGPVDQARLLWQAVRGFGITNVVSRISALNEIQRHDPKTPYYYLFFLGVDPACQGKGIGSLLLKHMLDRCDATRKPTYLQATHEGLIPFYQRYGYQQLETIPVRHGGPLLYPMWREPAA